MVRGNDKFESFLNPIQLKTLESNFRKVAANFELCFNGVYVNGDLNGDLNSTNMELVTAQLNVKRKGGASTDHPMTVNSDERGTKGKVPMKIFVGIIREKCVYHNNANNGVENQSSNVPKEGLRQSYGRVHGGKEDGNFESNVPKIYGAVSELLCKNIEHQALSPTSIDQIAYFKALISIFEGKRADVNGFLGKVRFARVGGVPSGMIEMPSLNDVGDEGISREVNQEDKGGTLLQNLASGLLYIPLSNVELLRSTLSNVPFTESIEFLPQMRRAVKEDHPDKKKFFSVQDFFRYPEAEGKGFFQELDRDGDGQVTLEDLEAAQKLIERDIEPWETIAVGALSGGLAAILTPFDVIKTRMMTTPRGQPITLSLVAISILHHEGPLGLFKRVVPRLI
ncbi:calcium-binding mitochondrial carrier protein SCaMC-1-like [Dorcoceras hygrometricum]|uniref:Calcium-binding mitochondrial carrier protein SCaMC-1-like n=1 Tax=Dorcoceras hygrometricum TaxID=472368 RepID=A0A2Z7BRZ4_9LAMI|nr:calcium-binding mitochondrial carrier protein SCaMC-1-like [Dorcoceras hygrometricum]